MSEIDAHCYVFECALDAAMPAEDRAAVVVEESGPHIAVMHSPGEDMLFQSAVFLAHEDAEALARVLLMLTGAEEPTQDEAERPAEPPFPAGVVREAVVLLRVLAGSLALLALVGVAALVGVGS